MSFIGHSLLLTLAFAFTVLDVAHGQAGFIYLDCGLRQAKGYNDSDTGLYFSSDDSNTDTGIAMRISPQFQTNSLSRQFFNVRTFPGSVGTRSCYTLDLLYGKSNKIFLTLGFYYGNYDDRNKLPKFDLYVGVNYWETVTIEDSSTVYATEIVYMPTSDYVSLCLVNTGQGTPFVSVIRLRPLDPLVPTYNTSSAAGGGSLKLLERWNFGATDSRIVRYPEDIYDRIWKPVELPTTTTIGAPISEANTNFSYNQYYHVPASVLSTAAQAPTVNDNLTVSFKTDNSSDEVYAFLHFAELLNNESSVREMDVYVNDFHWRGPFGLQYLSILTISGAFMPLDVAKYSENAIVVDAATPKSQLPAMLNAIEIYAAKDFLYYETEQMDVLAIKRIKEMYKIARNWDNGDPCLPKEYAWIGVNCSYSGFQPPLILSLNLSSSGLTGTIDSSLSNFTMIQSLDLSYNNLSGQVPEFLAWIPSLKYLYLHGNNFTGPLPPELLEKSKNGSLVVMSFDAPTNRTNTCVDVDACKKKKKTTVVPVLPLVAAILGIAVILSAIFIVAIIRKRRAIRNGRISAPNTTSGGRGTSIEQPLKKLTSSDVMNLIRGRDCIGEGGFGKVYKCDMDGVQVAVKILIDDQHHHQRNKDFKFEVNILSKVYHKNLINILGYCCERGRKAIVFEFIENGHLRYHLSAINSILSWEQRLSILIGGAEGLKYLHHHCHPPIIHRDIKSDNILLTTEYEPKLADFGLSRIIPAQTSVVAGTPGYMPPEFMRESTLSVEGDVYSFGVVIVEVVSGQRVTVHLTQWILSKVENRDLRGIVDPRLGGNYDEDKARRLVGLAVGCLSQVPSSRPNMERVVQELKECA